MIRKYVLPFVALAGIALAVWTTIRGAWPVPAAAPVADPSRAPFNSYVAGAGIVEASSENISASTPVPGLVVEVMATPGATAKKGDALFRLDDRDLKAELAVREATLESSKQKLARMKSMPRPEDIPPSEARTRAAEADATNAKNQYERVARIADKRAVSEEEVQRRKSAWETAEARAAEMRTSLQLLKAGSWLPDIAVAQADVELASSQVAATRTEIDRRTVRALVDSQILQVNVRPGEYAVTGTALVLLGATDVLHVRVDVDENDAWRFKEGAAAIGFVRGNKDLSTKLEYVRVEPFVVPKKSLTGASTERVDTRVMQVIYRFPRTALPVYVGQQMDVVMEAPPSGASR